MAWWIYQPIQAGKWSHEENGLVFVCATWSCTKRTVPHQRTSFFSADTMSVAVALRRGLPQSSTLHFKSSAQPRFYWSQIPNQQKRHFFPHIQRIQASEKQIIRETWGVCRSGTCLEVVHHWCRFSGQHLLWLIALSIKHRKNREGAEVELVVTSWSNKLALA